MKDSTLVSVPACNYDLVVPEINVESYPWLHERSSVVNTGRFVTAAGSQSKARDMGSRQGKRHGDDFEP